MFNRFRSRDFSPQKQEQEVEDSQAREAQQIGQSLRASCAIIELGLDGNILNANDKYLEIMGCEMHQIVGRNHRDFVDPEYISASDYESRWLALRRGESGFSANCRYINDGRGMWLQENDIPIKDGNGKIYKVVKIVKDVTERALSFSELECQVDSLRQNMAVIEFDMDGTIITANDSFLDVTGYTLNEIRGKHHRIFVDLISQNTEEYINFWKKLNEGQPSSGQFPRMHKTGKKLWLEAIYSPVFDSTGDPIKVIKYASDISNQKLLSNSLDNLIHEAGGVMGSIAKGDLTQTMKGEYTGELAVLSNAINVTVTQLKSMMREILEHSVSLVDGSRKLSSLNDNSQKAALRTAEQTDRSSSTALQISESVGSVATSLEEMSRAIHGIAENSASAVSVAEKAVGLSNEAKLNVTQLSESSNAISAVIKVINSIADQTNLLALNATIEAARAGDAGRGFAVVANEVKELAKETARATEDVGQRIKQIQTDSRMAEKIIGEISTTIEQINASQVSIAGTVEEQRSMSSHITGSINETVKGNNVIADTNRETAEVAKENLQIAEESQQTTRVLLERSDKLGELAARFTLN